MRLIRYFGGFKRLIDHGTVIRKAIQLYLEPTEEDMVYADNNEIMEIAV
ncbi:Uncharacterized protein dnm_078290 [Desulfonema magnum]|uniref:Uncharacterized protein n=1 Tax=Desulfonema magnum TaxID=45655 RepID=A0A975GS72_9BACT|nr:Uncharacterized protein dnm_078290 [Desulfonema magnum]